MTPINVAAAALVTAAAALFCASPTFAQSPTHSATPTTKRDPLEANAVVPPLVYLSAFTDYRSLGDEKLGWKEANDLVGRIGGWRAYAKEASEPDVPASPPSTAARPGSTAAPSPAPAGHGDHKMK